MSNSGISSYCTDYQWGSKLPFLEDPIYLTSRYPTVLNRIVGIFNNCQAFKNKVADFHKSIICYYASTEEGWYYGFSPMYCYEWTYYDHYGCKEFLLHKDLIIDLLTATAPEYHESDGHERYKDIATILDEMMKKPSEMDEYATNRMYKLVDFMTEGAQSLKDYYLEHNIAECYHLHEL